MLVLICLLMQGTLGAANPLALCVRVHEHSATTTTSELSSCSAARSCCASDAPDEDVPAQPHGHHSVLNLTLPCEESCIDCVDVDFPDDLPRVESNLQDQLADGVDTAPNVSQRDAVSSVVLSHGRVRATGPPDLHACAHRAVLTTTRLLI